jgi:hypothetical protein
MTKKKAVGKSLKIGKVDIGEWTLPRLEEALEAFNLEKIVKEAVSEVLEYAVGNDPIMEMSQTYDPAEPLKFNVELPLGDYEYSGPMLQFNFSEAVRMFIDFQTEGRDGKFTGKKRAHAQAIRNELLHLASEIDQYLPVGKTPRKKKKSD